MNYDSMKRMEDSFAAAHQQLEESMRTMQKLVKMMQGGALVGDGGTALGNAVEQKLLKRMKSLDEKMVELVQDIRGAVQATRDGVSTAQSRFK
jgi:molybdenum-dependent DNA-binding transcriptional regulator ModE